ncbi:hypothetical protein [Dankookia sp. P2]|uniref:hypothetical protein n=1 Tax=Dankookia sp. P2 TaxID=3423955 RepID=UPI003D6773D2
MTRFRLLASTMGLGLLLASGAMAQGAGAGAVAGAAAARRVAHRAGPRAPRPGLPAGPAPRRAWAAAASMAAPIRARSAWASRAPRHPAGEAPPPGPARPVRLVARASGGAQTHRGALEQQQRSAGVANPAARDAQQLRDLNAMSKQLAPNAPVPAPEAPAR